jgi:hypothetical protein
MTKPDSHALLSKLKSSMSKPAAPKPPTPASAPVPAAPAIVRPRLPQPTAKPVSSGEGNGLRAPKISVSLYRTDLARLDEIKEFMRGQGHRNLSDSEALRLACRAVKIGDGFLDYYRDMQREDGRRRVTAKVGK